MCHDTTVSQLNSIFIAKWFRYYRNLSAELRPNITTIFMDPRKKFDGMGHLIDFWHNSDLRDSHEFLLKQCVSTVECVSNLCCVDYEWPFVWLIVIVSATGPCHCWLPLIGHIFWSRPLIGWCWCHWCRVICVQRESVRANVCPHSIISRQMTSIRPSYVSTSCSQLERSKENLKEGEDGFSIN